MGGRRTLVVRHICAKCVRPRITCHHMEDGLLKWFPRLPVRWISDRVERCIQRQWRKIGSRSPKEDIDQSALHDARKKINALVQLPLRKSAIKEPVDFPKAIHVVRDVIEKFRLDVRDRMHFHPTLMDHLWNVCNGSKAVVACACERMSAFLPISL